MMIMIHQLNSQRLFCKVFICFFFFLLPILSQAQSVAVIGLNNYSSSGSQDGFAFVALEDIPDGTKIFFTERDYSASADAFSNAIAELVLEWTASGILAKGCVVAIHETSSNTGTVKASTTGCNGGNVTANFDSFSIGSSDPLYAFSSTGSGSSASILSGLTEIFSVMFINTGSLSSDQNPASDYPDAVVIDLNLGSGSGQYNPSLRNTTVTEADVTNPTNHQTIGGNAFDPLDVTIFTDIQIGVCPDDDMDGTCNVDDGCPMDPNKITPGDCGCGVADTDSDMDGTLDCNDGCPMDPAKTAPGACGCGSPDIDSDSDGYLDCNDGCPNNPKKISPSNCGCDDG